MKNAALLSLYSAFSLCAIATNVNAQWVDIKGQIVYDGPNPPPKRVPIKLDTNGKSHPDQITCAKDPDFLTEDWVINSKNKGIRDVFVWLAPDEAKRGVPFPQAKIKPALLPLKNNVVTIDQPCCRFIPAVLTTRVGQKLDIKSSPDISHNANFTSENNGATNVVIQAGAPTVTLVNALQAESGPLSVACNIHPWMKTTLRVFDHPYFATTDADGKFEISQAPAGKFRLYIWQATNGWKDGAKGRFGQTIDVKADNKGEMDLKEIKMKKND